MLLTLVCLSLELTGCDRGDPIVLIQLHPTNQDIIYVATNDYIYKTRDGGQTWTNLSQGMSHSRVISMAIDPTYPATVYAGTKGDAVFKSHDGGQRWVSMRSGLDDATISSVVNQFVFDPRDSNHIFLATTMGVFETKNGGENWTKKMEGMKEVLMVVTLGMDPTRTSTLYAGTSGGVYKTVDSAGRWEQVNNGLVPPTMVKTSRALNVTAVVVDPFDSRTVYAATLAGIFKSIDEGKSWNRIGESLPDQMIMAMIHDRARQGVIYVTGRDGVHRTTDGGATWNALNTGLTTTNVRAVAQSERDSNTLYAGTNGSGLYRSRNAGETWEPMPKLNNRPSVH
ncbi:conserved exported protein of unknown function [Nitrospira sp. KM1]|uniref:WD40/YVTN/BNR-like repeat-containing protein n=1 Tax=Nitrospira sp. KM1 TaxID=1936990 RepID=UPI0013A7645A|nr:hypothetical protein [Nitrospira sp. KM1]BCA55819.1 conserved exported protein of unknown function [Nitrospira sp. KM1]